MPTRAEICKLCDAYVAAVSAGDTDTIMSLFASDAEQQEPVGSSPNRGHEAIRPFFERNAGVGVSMTRIGPVLVVGNRALFMAHVRVEAVDGVREMTTADVLTVNEQYQITELLAFPDGAADPYDAPVRQ